MRPSATGGLLIALGLLAAAWAAEPAATPAKVVPVVAIGDGLVPAPRAAPPSAGSIATSAKAADASGAPRRDDDATVPGGWVAVVADCLDERSAGRFSVVDRAVPDASAASVRAGLPSVLELSPGAVLVGVAPPGAGADTSAWRADLTALVAAAHGKGAEVFLVGVVDPGPTASADAAAWDAVLDQIATSTPGVVHVPVSHDWPAPGADRSRLTVDGRWLSDEGHARVGAAVCDAVVAWDRK